MRRGHLRGYPIRLAMLRQSMSARRCRICLPHLDHAFCSRSTQQERRLGLSRHADIPREIDGVQPHHYGASRERSESKFTHDWRLCSFRNYRLPESSPCRHVR